MSFLPILQSTASSTDDTDCLHQGGMQGGNSLAETRKLDPFPCPFRKFEAEWLLRQGNEFKALVLLEEIKANEFWDSEEQNSLNLLRKSP